MQAPTLLPRAGGRQQARRALWTPRSLSQPLTLLLWSKASRRPDVNNTREGLHLDKTAEMQSEGQIWPRGLSFPWPWPRGMEFPKWITEVL